MQKPVAIVTRASSGSGLGLTQALLGHDVAGEVDPAAPGPPSAASGPKPASRAGDTTEQLKGLR
jgi:hypothetical protein